MLSADARARLEVWGDPVAHSRSPQLHSAAYRVLGLDWRYSRRRVDQTRFAGELAGLGTQWRGLSLTMPLKKVAYAAAATRDRRAELTGAVNTLLLGADGPRGFNTDVGGLVRDLEAWHVPGIDRARIVGAGATATSALVALADIGVETVEVVARREEAGVAMKSLGVRLGVAVSVVRLRPTAYGPTQLTIATLPGNAPVDEDVADALAAGGGMLYDVVYGDWPTVLAEAWNPAEPALSGLGMLVQQALLQVRIFVSGNADEPLPDEDVVLAAMRDAVVED